MKRKKAAEKEKPKKKSPLVEPKQKKPKTATLVPSMEEIRTTWPHNKFSNRAVSFWKPVGDLLVSGIKPIENRKSGLAGLKTLPNQGVWIAVHNAEKLMGQNQKGKFL